jgi:hypothetical protein
MTEDKGGFHGLVRYAIPPSRRKRLRFLGGAEGIRTPDLRSAIAALSQLSYSPARIGGTRLAVLPANVAAMKTLLHQVFEQVGP